VTGANDAGKVPVGALDGQPAQATSPAGTGPPLTVGTGVAVPLAAGADPVTPGALAEPLLTGPLVAVPLVGVAPARPVPDAVALDAAGEGELPACELTDALAQPAASIPAATSVTAAAQARRLACLGEPVPVIM
jgi:hypothetical protein